MYVKAIDRGTATPYTAHKDNEKSLGKFATAEEAARAYAEWRATLNDSIQVMASNEKLGPERQWLIRHGNGSMEWVSASLVGSREWMSAITCWEESQQRDYNHKAEICLGTVGCLGETGVEPCSVTAPDAERCAKFLHENWSNGALTLPNKRKVLGYTTYGKTLEAHSSEQQRTHTLLFAHPILPLARRYVPGFEAMENELVSFLHERFATAVELQFAHALRQSPETLRSTGFGVHQDTEDYPFILYTVVVKLTPDASGEAPSEMRVVGAERHFQYGPDAGNAGCFRAELHHASVMPKAEREHLKIAFFFKASKHAERRAKRAVRALSGSRALPPAPEDQQVASALQERETIVDYLRRDELQRLVESERGPNAERAEVPFQQAASAAPMCAEQTADDVPTDIEHGGGDDDDDDHDHDHDHHHHHEELEVGSEAEDELLICESSIDAQYRIRHHFDKPFRDAFSFLDTVMGTISPWHLHKRARTH